jgi:tRNA-2-methylthio-N6-dimethylallyladenosine synthase
MNRSYTREQYLDLASRLRGAIDGLALTTDIIVGFPTETEEDFLDTLSLVEEVAFDAAYTFIYSKRQGTPAADMVDDTPHEVIQERLERLAALVAKLSHDSNQKDLHTLSEVLVESRSKRDPNILVGHSQKMQTVHFPVPEDMVADDLIGKIVDVRVDMARTWYLAGSVEGPAR